MSMIELLVLAKKKLQKLKKNIDPCYSYVSPCACTHVYLHIYIYMYI